MQEKYFAASNSAQGFKNYFSEIFGRADHLYIIKGGPGTGKSSFMKAQAERAMEQGLRVELYYCSSDPDSIDGVLIHGNDRLIGIVDGTPPHANEPQYPGAYDEIINLGEFWNRELLQKQKNEIIALTDRKRTEYNRAYTFLRSVGNLRAVNDALLKDAVETEKMRSAAKRMLSHIPELKEGRATFIPALIDSVSMNGRVRLDTFEKQAKRLYFVGDAYGVGHTFLDSVAELLRGFDVVVRISYDPVTPDHVDGIFIEDVGAAFVLCDGSDEKFRTDGDGEAIYCDAAAFVNVKRFINAEKLRENRSEIRYTVHLAQSSLDGALHALAKAKIYHFLLEDIYGKAMHWRKKDEFEKAFVL